MSHNENSGVDLARPVLRRTRAEASKCPAGRSTEEPHRAATYSGAAQVAKTKARADASPRYLRALAQLQASRPSAPADSRTSPAVDQRIRTLARETAPRLSGQRPG
ncbi:MULTISPECIES: hypothetical protein [unclassified Kitasatospora]|uniref:hypothetical protein n=1 Tax=unclassified Kitasatospora TaxID=2633591 RepID=UPI0033E8396E